MTWQSPIEPLHVCFPTKSFFAVVIYVPAPPDKDHSLPLQQILIHSSSPSKTFPINRFGFFEFLKTCRSARWVDARNGRRGRCLHAMAMEQRCSTEPMDVGGLRFSWDACVMGPQIRALARTNVANVGGVDEEGEGIEVCAFDNRGMGRSSVPTKKSEYTTTIMAKDALAIMNHLGWRKALIVGHSMGAMIAGKLAALAPNRVSSLALLNVTGGGFECFPKVDSQMISLAIRFLRAKTPEQRAAVDLDTHYTAEYLDEYVGATTRRKILHQEYVKAISSDGMQSSYGFEGQVNACWTHKMTSIEIETIRSAGFLISVIHGRHDIVAQIHYARKLADKLQPYSKMVELHGAHLVNHERPNEVNRALTDLIRASEANLDPQEWCYLTKNTVGQQVRGLSILVNRGNNETEGRFTSALDILSKSRFCIFSILMLAIERATGYFRRLSPVKVGIADA